MPADPPWSSRSLMDALRDDAGRRLLPPARPSRIATSTRPGGASSCRCGCPPTLGSPSGALVGATATTAPHLLTTRATAIAARRPRASHLSQYIGAVRAGFSATHRCGLHRRVPALGPAPTQRHRRSEVGTVGARRLGRPPGRAAGESRYGRPTIRPRPWTGRRCARERVTELEAVRLALPTSGRDSDASLLHGKAGPARDVRESVERVGEALAPGYPGTAMNARRGPRSLDGRKPRHSDDGMRRGGWHGDTPLSEASEACRAPVRGELCVAEAEKPRWQAKLRNRNLARRSPRRPYRHGPPPHHLTCPLTVVAAKHSVRRAVSRWQARFRPAGKPPPRRSATRRYGAPRGRNGGETASRAP
jgi:hypothetical protein